MTADKGAEPVAGGEKVVPIKGDDTAESFHANIDAGLIHALLPILESNSTILQRKAHGFYVEPLPVGILVMATDGVVLAAVVDPNGQAAWPAHVVLPLDFVRSCAEPPPIRHFDQGEAVEQDLPLWARPGRVVLSKAAAYLEAAAVRGDDEDGPFLLDAVDSSRPGGYLVERAATANFDWRKVFRERLEASHSEPDPGANRFLDPRYLAAFVPLYQRFAGGTLGHQFVMTFGDIAAPVVLKIAREPNFIGLIMPQRATEYAERTPLFPEWLGLSASDAEGAADA